MKLLMVIIGISLNSFAQDSILFQDTWQLQDLVINNESHPPPTNNEISSISLYFYSPTDFNSTVCESLGGVIVVDEDNHNFFFTELLSTLGGGCNQPANSNYERIYFNFYYNNLRYNPFHYYIINNDDNSKTLTITSLNGDHAIYSSGTLSTENNLHSHLSLFYNKMNNSVDIKSKVFSGKFSIKLFDFQGKLILDLEEFIKHQKSIDLQNLTQGLYFVVLRTERGEILNRKIIKY